MRQLHVKVPSAQAELVLSIAAAQEAFAALAVAAIGADRHRHALVYLDLPTDRLEAFVDAVHERVPEAEFVLPPEGGLHAELPGRTPETLRERRVGERSTLELVVKALHSVSDWRGFLVYASVAGILVSYGLVYGVQYILVASMLIAPLGSPASVAVVGTAIGDWRLAARGAARFAVAVVVITGVGLPMGLILGLEASTPTMEGVLNLSLPTVVVALTAGIAGGQAQMQQSQSSMVVESGGGFLIAAALAPPAGVAGLSLATGQWNDVIGGGAVVALQYLAIQLGAWLVLRWGGVRPHTPTAAARGSTRCRNALLALVLCAFAGLVAWQVRHWPPYLERHVTDSVTTVARQKVATVPGVRLENLRVAVYPPGDEGNDGVIAITVVLAPSARIDSAAIVPLLRMRLTEAVSSRWPMLIPLIDVQVAPGGVGRRARRPSAVPRRASRTRRSPLKKGGSDAYRVRSVRPESRPLRRAPRGRGAARAGGMPGLPGRGPGARRPRTGRVSRLLRAAAGDPPGAGPLPPSGGGALLPHRPLRPAGAGVVGGAGAPRPGGSRGREALGAADRAPGPRGLGDGPRRRAQRLGPGRPAGQPRLPSGATLGRRGGSGPPGVPPDHPLRADPRGPPSPADRGRGREGETIDSRPGGNDDEGERQRNRRRPEARGPAG